MKNYLSMKEPIEEDTFSAVIRDRYNRDEILKSLVIVTLILLPYAAMLAFWFVSNGGLGSSVYVKLSSFTNQWLCVGFTAAAIIVSTVTCRMYTRLYNHSERDVRWRKCLIDYVRSVNGNVSEMQAVDAEISKKELYPHHALPTVFKYLIMLFSFYTIMLCCTTTSYNRAVPFLIDILSKLVKYPDATTVAVLIEIVGTFILMVPLLAVSLKTIIFMPHEHEVMQNRFTVAMSRALYEKGLDVPPMTVVTRGIPRKTHIKYMVLSLGLYSIYLFFFSIRSGNNHMYNQWAYEDAMNETIRTGKTDAFERIGHPVRDPSADDEPVFRDIAREAKDVALETKESIAGILSAARRGGKMPLFLLIGELFVLMLCSSYIFRIVVTGCEIYTTPMDFRLSLENIPRYTFAHWIKVLTIPMDLFFMSNAVGTVVGIASRRPSSWRAMVRSCVTFVIPTWMNAYVISQTSIAAMFAFNPAITTAILYDVLLLLVLSTRIKRFYYPPDEEIPPTSRWIRYAISGSITNPWRGYRKEFDLDKKS